MLGSVGKEEERGGEETYDEEFVEYLEEGREEDSPCCAPYGYVGVVR